MASMSMRGAHWPSLVAWHLSIYTVIVLVAVLVMLALRPRNPRVFGALAGGFAATAVLISSDVAYLSMMSYPAHMLDHIILTLGVAPFLAAAIPWRFRQKWAAVAFLSFTILVPLFHLTQIGGMVMAQADGHLVEEISFVVVGTLFWWPIYGVASELGAVARVTYVALAVPVMLTTGLVLWSALPSALATYGMRLPTMNIADIHQGGVAMIIAGGVGMLFHLGLSIVAVIQRELHSHTPVGFVDATATPVLPAH